MPAARADWTVDMLDALPDDGQRYEIIDGELFVTPAPSDVHQLVAGALFMRLQAFLRPTHVARAMISRADVRKGDRTRNRVQPDVFAIRLIDGKRLPYPYGLADLLLAIEVESPSNPLLDYQVKRELYLSHGVPEYWIVNAEARRSSKRIDWRPAGASVPMLIDLPAMFEDALG